MNETGNIGAVIGVLFCLGSFAMSAKGMNVSELSSEMFKEHRVITRAGWQNMPGFLLVIQNVILGGWLGWFAGFVLGGVLSFFYSN